MNEININTEYLFDGDLDSPYLNTNYEPVDS